MPDLQEKDAAVKCMIIELSFNVLNWSLFSIKFRILGSAT